MRKPPRLALDSSGSTSGSSTSSSDAGTPLASPRISAGSSASSTPGDDTADALVLPRLPQLTTVSFMTALRKPGPSAPATPVTLSASLSSATTTGPSTPATPASATSATATSGSDSGASGGGASGSGAQGRLRRHLALSASLPALPEVAVDDEREATRTPPVAPAPAEQVAPAAEPATTATEGTRESRPPGRTKIRLFNIFSPVFLRLGRRKHRHNQKQQQPKPGEEQQSRHGHARRLSAEEVAVVAVTATADATTEEAPRRSVDDSDAVHGRRDVCVHPTPAPPEDDVLEAAVRELSESDDASIELDDEDIEEEEGRTLAPLPPGVRGSSDDASSCSDFDVVDGSVDGSSVSEDEGKQDEEDCCEEEEEEEEVESFDPYFFMGRLARFAAAIPEFMRSAYFAYPSAVPLLGAKAAGAPRHTLVLDLDETLVHCSIEPVASPDFVFPVVYDGSEFCVHAYRRPHLRSFLRAAARLFEVVLFTASLPQYAEGLLRVLDPGRRVFAHCLCRGACVQGFNSFIKDLSVLGRDLATTVIVDNSPQAFSFQPDNGIPIRSYFDGKDDRELPRLLPVLQRLAQADDVRPILRQRYQVSARIEHAMALARQPGDDDNNSR